MNMNAEDNLAFAGLPYPLDDPLVEVVNAWPTPEPIGGSDLKVIVANINAKVRTLGYAIYRWNRLSSSDSRHYDPYADSNRLCFWRKASSYKQVYSHSGLYTKEIAEPGKSTQGP